MRKFVVMTSIFPPTLAVRKFAQMKDWQLVRGSRKSHTIGPILE